jgi:hypothetical protein
VAYDTAVESAVSSAVYQYDKRYLKSLGKYNVWALVRMALLLFAAFGLFLVIPSEGLRGLFLIAAVLTVALFQILLDSTAENILLNQTLTIAFGLFFSLAAFMQYIPSFGPWCRSVISFSTHNLEALAHYKRGTGCFFPRYFYGYPFGS